MIDTAVLAVPLRHLGPRLQRWRMYNWYAIPCPRGSRLRGRREVDGGRDVLVLAGALVRWHQAHNVWSTSDLPALVAASLPEILDMLQARAGAWTRAQMLTGDVELRRVDVYKQINCGSEERARELARMIRACVVSARRPRARGAHDDAHDQEEGGGTAYIGRGSSWVEMAAYSKSGELRAHRLPHILPRREEIAEYAGALLRIEFRLRSSYLQARGLDRVKAWRDPGIVERIMRERIDSLAIPTATRLPAATVEGMRPALRAVYEQWLSGADMREVLSERTCSRHRRALRDGYGVEIALPRNDLMRRLGGRELDASVLSAITAPGVPAPAWAVGFPVAGKEDW